MAALFRTTSFYLPPELLGDVHLVRAGPGFMEEWRGLEGRHGTREKGERHKQLPHGSLTRALITLSGDFVQFLHRPWHRPSGPLLVSRSALSAERLQEALLAWELSLFNSSYLADAASDLYFESASLRAARVCSACSPSCSASL